MDLNLSPVCCNAICLYSGLAWFIMMGFMADIADFKAMLLMMVGFMAASADFRGDCDYDGADYDGNDKPPEKLKKAISCHPNPL